MGGICKNRDEDEHLNEVEVVHPANHPSLQAINAQKYSEQNPPVGYSKFKPKDRNSTIPTTNLTPSQTYVYPVRDSKPGKRERFHNFVSRHRPHLHHHKQKDQGQNQQGYY